jgi:hypothetical protein
MAYWKSILIEETGKVDQVRFDGFGRFDFGVARPDERLAHEPEPGESMEQAIACAKGVKSVVILKNGKHHGWGHYDLIHPITGELIKKA